MANVLKVLLVAVVLLALGGGLVYAAKERPMMCSASVSGCEQAPTGMSMTGPCLCDCWCEPGPFGGAACACGHYKYHN